MWFMHFASLMEGGKLAWLDPVNKENSCGVARGLPRCIVYRHDIPDFIVTHLVGLGNDTNADAAETNHLQTCRASETAGSSATTRRWQVIGHYERCWGFFRDSQKVKVVSGKT